MARKTVSGKTATETVTPQSAAKATADPPGQRGQGVGHPRGGQRQALRRRPEGCRDPQGQRRQEGRRLI